MKSSTLNCDNTFARGVSPPKSVITLLGAASLAARIVFSLGWQLPWLAHSCGADPLTRRARRARTQNLGGMMQHLAHWIPILALALGRRDAVELDASRLQERIARGPVSLLVLPL